MNYSPIIYKYRTWSDPFHKLTLLRNELYYASPSQINDPFDFKITIDLSMLDSSEKREKYINKLLRDAAPILKERKINPVLKKRELMIRLTSETQKMQEEFDSTKHEWTDKRYGIISFSERWDSILMWSHYSENHKGFCVGYDRKKIEESNLFGVAGIVNYDDNYPKIDPIADNLLKEILIESHTKASDWSYEKEYRLTKLWSDFDPLIEQRTINVPNDFIKEIILGLATPQTHQKEIIEIAKQKNIPVYAIVKKPRAFLLDKKKI